MKEKLPIKMFSNKKFLSTHPYWDSSITWYVGIEEGWRGGKEMLGGNIKISDCYKSIDLEISDDKQLVLEKLDNLIHELQAFRESYLDVYNKFEGGIREENSGTENSGTGGIGTEEWIKTLTKVCEIEGKTYYLHPEEREEIDWEDSKEWVKSLNIHEGCSVQLPSRDILRKCYEDENVREMFSGNHFYWTSEEFSDSQAFLLNMLSGFRANRNKMSTAHKCVRPVVVVPKSA